MAKLKPKGGNKEAGDQKVLSEKQFNLANLQADSDLWYKVRTPPFYFAVSLSCSAIPQALTLIIILDPCSPS
jgi:hypothetical protein